uniref:7TM GPCR serpentine receptor class x (Srx) domain-containing protein n=1 Tax=Panagrellus redivivus TaxID=6233 RepID=A0A7E4ZYP3_PANRE
MAGYISGFFRNIGNYTFALIMDVVGFSIYVNCVWGTTLSLLNRYIFTFYPQYRIYIENKLILGLFLIGSLFCYCLIAVGIVRTLDPEVSREYLRNETQQALLHFIDEPTLIYISNSGGVMRLLAAFAFLMLLDLLPFDCCINFCHHV